MVDSEDEIGESALAFNHLANALSTSMRILLAVRSFSEMLTSQLEIGSVAEEALRRFAGHGGAAGGLILYETEGELKVAASRGLRDPQSVAVLATAGTFSVDQRGLIDLVLQGLGRAFNSAPSLTTGCSTSLPCIRSPASTTAASAWADCTRSSGGQCAPLRRSALREGDVLLSYGGAELLAILPVASADDLRQVGERARRAVEDSAFADGDKTLHVTLIGGGAAFPNPGVEHEDGLIRLAVEAMYRARDSGRNRVEISR